jgi:hypothetical protein
VPVACLFLDGGRPSSFLESIFVRLRLNRTIWTRQSIFPIRDGIRYDTATSQRYPVQQQDCDHLLFGISPDCPERVVSKQVDDSDEPLLLRRLSTTQRMTVLSYFDAHCRFTVKCPPSHR